MKCELDHAEIGGDPKNCSRHMLLSQPANQWLLEDRVPKIHRPCEAFICQRICGPRPHTTSNRLIEFNHLALSSESTNTPFLNFPPLFHRSSPPINITNYVQSSPLSPPGRPRQRSQLRVIPPHPHIFHLPLHPPRRPPSQSFKIINPETTIDATTTRRKHSNPLNYSIIDHSVR
jgi:hypothetical protein